MATGREPRLCLTVTQPHWAVIDVATGKRLRTGGALDLRSAIAFCKKRPGTVPVKLVTTSQRRHEAGAEALAALHTTGRMPMELARERDELIRACEAARFALTHDRLGKPIQGSESESVVALIDHALGVSRRCTREKGGGA